MAKKTELVLEDLDEVEELEDAEGEAAGGESLTAKQAATLLGTDARTFRKFLRVQNGLVGQGHRWAIDPEDMEQLKKSFAAWGKGGTKPKLDADAPKGKKVNAVLKPAADIPDADDLEELDEFEDLDDLEEI